MHRPYRAADRPACIDLFGTNVPRFFHEDERQDFARFLDTEARHYLVVLEGELIVGCGGFALNKDGRQASLCWGMVRSDRHGEGIGAQLLLARLQVIATTSATHVRLATSQHTAGFYRRYGFVAQSIQPDGFAPGLDAVEMRLRLQSKPGVLPLAD
jgi:predicted GNAT family N-acyltransferase